MFLVGELLLTAGDTMDAASAFPVGARTGPGALEREQDARRGQSP